ncbi:MAG: hypothetical protein TREMPRED_002655 [Tremellales sp. Tagirdzhanova-0007]|nr:MAG: hypothetical protein TREMPRED_002655 [Tremellales sp. Tagirdzhanova-0007]
MAATSVPGPSRQTHLNPPTAPSTSGDSESTVPQPVEKGLEVGLLKELARSSLIESLNDIQGAKTLILDPTLAGPLGLITEVALLKHQAVDKMFWLEDGPLNVTTRNVVWLCRPKMSYMRIIAEQIRSQQGNTSAAGPLVYTLLLVPRATELCRKVLEDEGVAGDVEVSEFKLEFIPMEDDLLSLEMDDASRDIYLNGDETPIYYSSLALMTFQRAFGLFPRILGKGDGAQKLANLLRRHRASGSTQFSDIESSDQVDALIILDRSVDWVTPMSHIEVDPALLEAQSSPTSTPTIIAEPSPPSTKKRKHHLTGQKDKLFADIRDLNFAVVGTRLSRLARRLEGDYGGAKNLKSVSQMKDFVGKLGGLQGEQQNLRLHTGLTEQIMPITKTDAFNRSLEAQQNLVAGYDTTAQLNIVEDLMNQEAPWPVVLRLAVLMSLTSGGIKPKVLETFRRDFLQVYGYHHLPLLISLQDLGLLTRSPPSTTQAFPAVRKPLRLIVDDVDDATPADISYVYSGYAPLSVRLIQCVTQKNVIQSGAADLVDERNNKKSVPIAHPIAGWKGFKDVLAIIPGATVDVRQKSGDGESHPSETRQIPRDGERRESFEMIRNDRAAETPSAIPDRTMTTVVFFLGGCTYTEISALRWMSMQTRGRKFLITTTGIINGTSLLESMGDRPPVPLKTS